MHRGTFGTFGRGVSGITAALVACALAAAADGFVGMGRKAPGPDAPKSGPVVVTVRYPDGAPAKGIPVVAGRGEYSTDGDGSVAVTGGVPSIPGVFSAVASRGEGGFLGMFKKNVLYAAFEQVHPKAGQPLEIALKLSPAPNLDAACRPCHPEKGQGIGAVIKCTHKSGVPVKPEQAARVASFNRENEELRKAGKPFYPAIVLEPRKVGKGLFSETKPFLVCGSCHTNHVETGQFAYALMPFAEKSVLCRGCHV